MRVVSTKLTDEEYQALYRRAREEGGSVASLVRKAVLAYLNFPAPVKTEVSDRLSALEKRVEDLERAVNEIRSLISKATANTGNVATGSGGTVGDVASQAVVQGKAGSRERRRVIVFSLEWASRKGINVEEYMARREREGYICNETSREVVCVLHQDIEQIVTELNSAGAKMGELDKVLAGEKLETARIAERAGLLWYDNGEKRWKAPL
jgi:uncharacterized protein (UPF0335 family)